MSSQHWCHLNTGVVSTLVSSQHWCRLNTGVKTLTTSNHHLNENPPYLHQQIQGQSKLRSAEGTTLAGNGLQGTTSSSDVLQSSANPIACEDTDSSPTDSMATHLIPDLPSIPCMHQTSCGKIWTERPSAIPSTQLMLKPPVGGIAFSQYQLGKLEVTL